MTAQPTQHILRPSRWLIVAAALAASVFIAGFAMMYRLQGLSVTTLLFGGLSILGTAGVLEALTRRVVLGADAVRIANLWSRKNYPRSGIESVTWAAGCPVSIKLSDGRWVSLPAVGSSSQGTVNTIRAWLKKAG